MFIKMLKRFSPGRILKRHGITANIMLTRRCNVKCPYCEVVSRNNGLELDAGEWRNIIGRLSKSFINIVFTGGEPLLFEGVEDLIDYACRFAFVGLLTNGRLLTEEKIEKLNNLDYLNVSSEYLFTDTKNYSEDLLCLLGEFKKRYKCFVSSTMVVDPNKCMEIPKMIRRLTDYGIYAEICIAHFRDKDEDYWFRTVNPELDFCATKKTGLLEILQNRLIRMKRSGYLINTPDAYIRGMSDFANGKKRMFKCFAAEKFICVNNDGFIMPCQDLKPTDLHASGIINIRQIRKLKKYIPNGCNCWWDCAYFYSLLDVRAIKEMTKESFFGLHNYLKYRLYRNE